MKIKQTVKGLLFGLIATAIIVTGFFALTPPASAACGGVETSIINCEKTGLCKDGENPYEGTNPADDADKKLQYKTDYGHDYGKCTDGSSPDSSIESSGVWSLLLMVINILTAGIGLVAVGGIVYASILYTSAGGSAEQTKKAITVITDIVIGVIAYAGMYALLNFLVPGGLFN